MALHHLESLSREHFLFLIIGALTVLVLVLAYRVYFPPSTPSETHIATESSDMPIERAQTPI
jgi:hypothetical protein